MKITCKTFFKRILMEGKSPNHPSPLSSAGSDVRSGTPSPLKYREGVGPVDSMTTVVYLEA